MKENISKVQVTITPRSIFLIAGILILLALVYKLSAVLYIFFIAFAIYSTLKPTIVRLEKRNRIQKAVSIPLILATFLGFLALLIIMVVQNISVELKNLNINQLTSNFVNVVEGAFPFIDNYETENIMVLGQSTDSYSLTAPEIFKSTINGGGTFLFKLLSSTAGVVLSFFTIFVVAYYMLLKKGNIFEGILKFVPDITVRAAIRKYILKVENKLGSWLLSQFILMLIIGLLSYVGVALPMLCFDTATYPIGRFAVTLAVISGILEVVPNIGPIITFLLSIFLSIALGGELVLPQTIYIAALFIIVQQIEAIFIVPNIMKQVIGLDPIVTILGVIAGASLSGPIGAVLIIPVIATAQIVIEFFVNEEELLNPETVQKIE